MFTLRPVKFLSTVCLLAFAGAALAVLPVGAAAPTPTAKPTTKPAFELCKPYPSPTAAKATPTIKGAPVETAVPTNTPEPTLPPPEPTETPTLGDTPTNIPTGKKPADMLITLQYSQVLQRAGKACLEVYSVTPYGPADVAGLLPGDLILGIEKTVTTELSDFYGDVSKRAAGDTVTVTVQRGTDSIGIPVKLGLNPLANPNATLEPTATKKK